MRAAVDAIRAAVLRPLREGKVDPQLAARAVAWVAGELGADTDRSQRGSNAGEIAPHLPRVQVQAG
jgi:hypothetical protein